MHILRDFVCVGLGSFFGGGLRMVVTRLMTTWCGGAFPIGTFTVNVLGCFLIGLLSAVAVPGGWLSPQGKLLLTTGFCGGFTTFSTFMQENGLLLGEHQGMLALLYVLCSLVIGLLALVAGREIGILLR